MTRPTLPLRLTQDGRGKPQLILGGIDITPFVAANGVDITYDHAESRQLADRPAPQVTLRFCPGRLNLDFDVELLDHILEDSRADAAEAGS